MNVDGGDDFYIALGGVFYHFGNIVGSIKAAVGGFLAGTRGRGGAPAVAAPVHPPGSYVGEGRVVVYLDAPALVVGEVPDEFVQFVCHHKVEVPFDLFDGEEVAAGVELAASPRETGAVQYGAFGHDDVGGGSGEDVGRQHLHKGLEGVEEPGLAVGADEYAFGQDLKQVAFVAELGIDGVVEGEQDAVFVGIAYECGTHMHPPQGVGDVFGCGGVASDIREAEAGGG